MRAARGRERERERMMRRTASVGVALAGALALSTVVASVAAAAPPEFAGSFPDAFTSTTKTATLETVGRNKGHCKAATGSGEVSGSKSLLITLTWTGCKKASLNCQNTGKAGVIVTGPLAGTLGYVTQRPKTVGIDLSSPTGGQAFSFTCGEDSGVEVYGSVIGKVSLKEPITFKFTQKEGHQRLTHLLGGPEDVPMASLLGGPLQEAGIATAVALTFATPMKVIA
jgi:hypothetical protein